MPDYTELDGKKKKQLHILETFQRKRRELQIRTAIRQAVIRLDQAISPLLDESNRDDALLLNQLADSSSIAYRRLALLPGAIRFCDFRISKALEVLRGGEHS